jgi:hypothetical protein
MRTGVDTQDNAALALFAKHLEVRDVGACRNQPVHVADVIAFPVFTDLVEVQTGTTKYRGIQAGKCGVDEMMCRDTQGAGLVTEFQQVIKLRMQFYGVVANVCYSGCLILWRSRYGHDLQ